MNELLVSRAKVLAAVVLSAAIAGCNGSAGNSASTATTPHSSSSQPKNVQAGATAQPTIASEPAITSGTSGTSEPATPVKTEKTSSAAKDFIATAQTALTAMKSVSDDSFKSINFDLAQMRIGQVSLQISDSYTNQEDADKTQRTISDRAVLGYLDPQNMVFINSTGYEEISSELVQQSLAIHEALRLSGNEADGDFKFSAKYLAIESGGTWDAAVALLKTVDNSIKMGMKCQPLFAEDGATLFSMIADQKTTISALQKYLATHTSEVPLSEADAYVSDTNDQCENFFTASLDQGHSRDAFFELIYKNALSDPNSLNQHTSLYESVLAAGSPELLALVKKDAETRGIALRFEGFYIQQTELTMAAQYNPDPAMVQYLIQTGADVNAADKYGRTALIAAAESGSRQVVEALIAAGAKVNATETKASYTALMRAADKNNAAVIEPLIKAGADVNAANTGSTNQGSSFTALHFAAQNNSVDAARELIRLGASVN